MGSNSTACPIPEHLARDPVPLFSNGNVNFKAHDVGWLVAAIMSIIAVTASVWLIRKHLTFFYSPHQQRHIVRILFMVPIYAITSLLSYLFYQNAIYFQLLRDCYEAIVIASFFSLLLSYLSSPHPSPDDPCPQPYATREERTIALHETFKNVKVGKWMFPFGRVKWRPAGGGPEEGMAFLWYMRIGIGQYVILRPLSTLAAVISQALGFYCLTSWSPRFMHIYTSAVVSISVSIAMYCVLQLYWPVRKELEPYHPVLKFLSVKSVVFLTFWQETFLGVLEAAGAIKDHEYWSAAEIAVGLSALLSCFEMMVFGFVHIRAFTYLPYRALTSPLQPIYSPSTLTDIPIPKSFAHWTRLEITKTREAVLERKLARIPSRVELKSDGAPQLRQTRVLPALWKCLWLSDVARELKSQTKFVVGRAPSFMDSNTRKRNEAMKMVFGGSRVRHFQGKFDEDYDDEEDMQEGADELEARLLRARQMDPPPTIALVGSCLSRSDAAPDSTKLAPPTLSPFNSVRDCDVLEPTFPSMVKSSIGNYGRNVERPLWCAGEYRPLPNPWQEGDEQIWLNPEDKARWRTLPNRFGNDHDDEKVTSAFEQRPRLNRLEPNVVPAKDSFIPPSQRLAKGTQLMALSSPTRGALPHLGSSASLESSDMLAMVDFADALPPPHKITETASDTGGLGHEARGIRASGPSQMERSRRNSAAPGRLVAASNVSSPFSEIPSTFLSCASGLRHPDIGGHRPINPRAARRDWVDPFSHHTQNVGRDQISSVPPSPSSFQQPLEGPRSAWRPTLPLGAAPPSTPIGKGSGRGFLFEEY